MPLFFSNRCFLRPSSDLPPGPPKSSVEPFSSYQKFVVAVLAFLQFTIIFDFMIISPLSATVMPDLGITPSQFGLVVSAYAFSAGIAALLAAGFADKFDRKRLLLFFYAGFIGGTLLCGAATSYPFLLIARTVTGLFGGVIGSIVLAITTDLFSFSMRGRVMGFIQSAFAGSQVLGLPAGLYLSNHFGWHAPFYLIALISAMVGGVIVWRLRPIDAHLKLRSDKNAFRHLIATIARPRYLLAFSTTTLLSLGGFMLMPFGSVYMVHNLGIELSQLPVIYLISGICSIFIGPLVGRASDRFGKFRTFLFGTFFSILMVLTYTNLGVTPLPLVIAVNSLMFLGIFSRMIPAQALMSAIPEPASRGAFMSVSSSMQQISGGIASVFAGMVIMQRADGTIEGFPLLGHILVVIALIALVMIYFVHKLVQQPPAAPAAS